MRPTEVRTSRCRHWHRRSLAFPSGLACGILLVFAAVTVAQQSSVSRGVRLHNWQGVRQFTESERPFAENGLAYYGIMGPVSQPGVYETTDSALLLTELVQAAQGPTAATTTRAHVIRHGRSGLQLVYSPTSTDRLMPGDVVVFDALPSHHPSPALRDTIRVAGFKTTVTPTVDPRPATIDVAFVGLQAQQPIIVPLDTRAATLPKVIAALRQPPELIRSVQVIRTSRSAPSLPVNHQPESLAQGDVVVFSSSLIDHQSLAQADAFPSPMSIEPSAQQTVSESVNSAPLPTIETAAIPPARTFGPKLAFPSPIDHSAKPEPERTFEEPTLPPLALDSPPATVIPGIGHRSEGTSPATVGSTPPRFAERTPAAVVSTGLLEPPATHRDDTSGSEQTSFAPAPQPTLARPAPGPAPAEPQPATDFTAESFDRLAMVTEPLDTSASEGTIESATDQLASVPLPLEPAAPAGRTGLTTRATTLGITVLIVAGICFAASLVWSRLDDSTGLTRHEQLTPTPEHAATSSDQHRQPLDRLIENSLPLIEEQTLLPERIDYHGEAVGQRRIRIDAREPLPGPHFTTAAPRMPERETAVAASSSRKTGEPAAGQTLRIDTPAETASPVAKQTSPTDDAKPDGGLLERVLVAMEREKRR